MSDLFFFADEVLARKPKPSTKAKAAAFVDKFTMTYSQSQREHLSDYELGQLKGANMLFDVECYPNYFMIAFRPLDGSKVLVIDQTPNQPLNVGKLEWIMTNFLVIGFNSANYDIPMIRYALTGASCKQLHEASNKIIGGMRQWDFEKKYKLRSPRINHIDIIEVAPLQGSLKMYAGRLHAKRMQDLPLDPTKPLKPEDVPHLQTYCFNDLDNTGLAVEQLTPQLELRTGMSNQYRIDLRSKSDAQIAEAVVTNELRSHGIEVKRAEIDPKTVYRYKVPSFISYRSATMNRVLEIVRNAEFSLDINGYVFMPPELEELQIEFGQGVYRMGIGGLHSSEKCAAHKADENTLLIDRDVTSYYPSIILNLGLYPEHLTPDFLKVYRAIVDRRVQAKKAGNKVVADSLKITVNGSFGKFGSRYSALYSPDLLLQVTLTGQLSLLMLIEMVEDIGAVVVSANTDGIVIRVPKSLYAALNDRIKWWEELTGFGTEETRYEAIYSRDVNNYLALKSAGKWKEKGAYVSEMSLSKNPEHLVCIDAVKAFIEKGVPLVETIRGCQDIRRFCVIRQVTGGANKSGQHLGKVIRWYFSSQMKGEINRNSNGNKVPNSDRSRPLMELPESMPSDVDYQRYIDIAQEMLYDIGAMERPEPIPDYGPLFS